MTTPVTGSVTLICSYPNDKVKSQLSEDPPSTSLTFRVYAPLESSDTEIF